MGLDNGIIVKNKYKELLEELGPDYWEDHKSKDDNDYDLCYWRKCWGIRNAIIKKFHFPETCGEYKLDLEDIPVIIKILEGFCNSNNWEEYGDSIWEYDDYIHTLIEQIVNLKIFYKYWKKHPEIEVYFYDSY